MVQPTHSRPGRDAMLDAALALLREHGPEALTVRRIAQAVGASTQAVYSSYGGKQALVAALYHEGFRLLRERFERASHAGGPIERLRRMGQEYRAFAGDETELFLLMFGRSVPHFRPDPDALAGAWPAFLALVEGVQAAIDAGELSGDAYRVARILWQAVHGLTHLEIGGYLGRGPEGAAQFDDLQETILAGLRVRT
ncbi:TetR/AcrR family transcriptional regulator [Allonocardiopsis opalescens]|uniref:TetR family transcriptional regulator n=1 Tax=Allonocardiopsis opalescens TaxID=1144618 RepID=A0A2T0Q981_9ACTN|nr:TetR/AcrR family transcriptional regulator [Allonocardiopsis opalescens]PRY00449.1 TetR family transcriptional regulator [Allonocardiopsis opalescens]